MADTLESPKILQIAVASPLRTAFDYLSLADNRTQIQDLLSEESSSDDHDGEEHLSSIEIGTRVQINFGRRNVTGVVIGVSDTSDYPLNKLKPIKERLDFQASLSEEIIDLCLWAEKYYQHPIGEIVFYALPKRLREKQSLIHKDHTHWQATKKGLLISLDGFKRAKNQKHTLSVMQEHPDGLSQKALASLGISTSNLNALVKKGLVDKSASPKRETHKVFNENSQLLKEPHLTFNEEQEQAFQVLKKHLLEEDTFRCFLLNGITSSGKTEVYLQIIDAALKQNKQALILVPEIGLTPQTLQRFESRFVCEVTSLHSGLTDLERYNNWYKAKTGQARIIIGTRSAIFADLPDLGIIIVDEEHDGSYKQQEGFKFSARDMAIVRAQKRGIPIILGTATPSFETLHNTREGKYTGLYLKKTASAGEQAKISFIDTRNENLLQGISQKTIQKIRAHLERQNQVLVFINRRGYSPALICGNCNWLATCPYCDARFTYHKNKNKLICHHCNFQQALIEECPKCHSQEMHKLGQGTEKVEETLGRLFTKHPLMRIDRDSTQSRDAFEKNIHKIKQGESCILVGTQMLAKGHHFPKVSLVCVLEADGGFFSSDFRALEKMSQLIVQISGRAGREIRDSEVIIQTEYPDHPMLQTLAMEGYLPFAKELLREREEAGFPPFGHLAILRAEAPLLATATAFLDEAEAWFQSLIQKHHLEDKVSLLGPAPAPMERRGGRYRAQLLFQANNRRDLQILLSSGVKTLTELKLSKKARWTVDVDPVEMF